MHDNNPAVDGGPHGPSMLANLMSAAAAYAVRRGVPLTGAEPGTGTQVKHLSELLAVGQSGSELVCPRI